MNFGDLALYKNARILIVFKQNHIRKERRKMNLHQALVKVQTDFKNSQQNVYNYFDLLASRKLALMPKMVEIHGFGKDKPITIDTKSNTAKQFLNEVLTNKDGLYINSIETTAENKLVYKANNFDINVTLIQIANSIDYVLVLDFDISKLKHGLKFIKLNGLERYLNHAPVIQANKNLLNRYKTFYNFVYQIQDEETTLANALGSFQEKKDDLNEKFADEKPDDQVVEESNVKKVKPELIENTGVAVKTDTQMPNKDKAEKAQEFDDVQDMPKDNLDSMLDGDNDQDSSQDQTDKNQSNDATASFDSLLKSIGVQRAQNAKPKRKQAQPVKDAENQEETPKKPISTSTQKITEQSTKESEAKTDQDNEAKMKIADKVDSKPTKATLQAENQAENEEKNAMTNTVPEEKPDFAKNDSHNEPLSNVNPVDPNIPMIESLDNQAIERTEITPSLHRQMRTPVHYARQHSSSDLKALADELINHFDTVLIKMTQNRADMHSQASPQIHNTAVLSSRAQTREHDDAEMAKEFAQLDVL